MPELTLILALPHKSLSPNARVHWRTKMVAKREARKEAAWMSKNALRLYVGDAEDWPAKTINLTPTFFWHDKRKRDKTNAAASLKPHIDGLQEGGIIEDDVGVDMMPVRFELDRTFPRVELHIERTDKS